MRIYLTDNKGSEWVLQPTCDWKRNRCGLTVSWWIVVLGPWALRDYPIVPIPCFTEWWT